jgi:signal transduction histidine kinase
MKTTTRSLYATAIVLAIGLVIAITALLNAWRLEVKVTKSIVDISELAIQADEDAGYGGFIHAFKNYVLRGDQVYRSRVLETHQRINVRLDALEAIAEQHNIQVKYAEYRETLREYLEHLNTITRMHENGDAVAAIDSAVKVDDTSAVKEHLESTENLLAGLKRLDRTAVTQRNFLMATLFLMFALLLAVILTAIYRAKSDAERRRALANENALLAEQVTVLELFSSASAHDLRGPLQQIIGLSEQIETGLDQDASFDASPVLHKIIEKVLQTNALIDSLIEYTRARIDTNPSSNCHCKEALLAVKNLYDDAHGYEISISGEFGTVVAEQSEVELVLRNLISNAIKHNDRSSGLIEIIGKQNNGEQEIAVKDDGPGIADSVRKTMFSPFVSAGKRSSGQGLGLAMVANVIKKCGGRITVDPNSGRGTTTRTFWPAQTQDIRRRSYMVLG